nr:DUF4389 domain-containing protein [Microlunatus panaciterrae]
MVLGILLAMAGLSLGGVGVVLGSAALYQGDHRFSTTASHRYQVDSYALTSTRLDVVINDGLDWQSRWGDVGTFMIRGTAAQPDQNLFIGIAPEADVARYLADVKHSELTQVLFRPFRASYREVAGSAVPKAPGSQDFWTVSAEGPGTQQVEFPLRSGTWTVVVMNADASPAVAADLQAGVRSDLLGPAAIGTLITGLVLVLVGIPLLVAGSAGLGRTTGPSAPRPPLSGPPSGPGPEPAPPAEPAGGAVAVPPPPPPPYPARLSGELDPSLSRWFWLVKWFLAIPHLVILAFLWFAFVINTIIAGFAILFTGRYPRSLFDFNVGVMRWNWRVGFYAYSVLGTDRYPPFSLARTDYPADFDVDYPERLSRGLVLVKSWLLAIPHLLIIAVFTASPSWRNNNDDWPVSYGNNIGTSLLGLLVFVAALVLLITGSYNRALFDLIVGLNRWIYRVFTYVALMRDEYPPFRLDQGGSDPSQTATMPPSLPSLR